ncbi:MAG: hypothetical protein Q9169_005059 [Polycauliona sp. 2 TL-2023]
MPVLISRSGRLGSINRNHPTLEQKRCPNRSSDWENHRSIIQDLYVTEDKPLPDVVDEMRRKYNFVATERQYKRRISEWHLDKNVKDEEMRAIIAVEAMRLRQGKKSIFHVRGRPLDRKKIHRFIQRKRIDRNALDHPPTMQQSTITSRQPITEYASMLPVDIRCSTPPNLQPTLLEISETLGRKSSDHGSACVPTKADIMASDISHSLEHRSQGVKPWWPVNDRGTRDVILNQPLGRNGPFHPSGIDETSTDAINDRVPTDRQSKHDHMSSLGENSLEVLLRHPDLSLYELLQHSEKQQCNSGE